MSRRWFEGIQPPVELADGSFGPGHPRAGLENGSVSRKTVKLIMGKGRVEAVDTRVEARCSRFAPGWVEAVPKNERNLFGRIKGLGWVFVFTGKWPLGGTGVRIKSPPATWKANPIMG